MNRIKAVYRVVSSKSNATWERGDDGELYVDGSNAGWTIELRLVSQKGRSNKFPPEMSMTADADLMKDSFILYEEDESGFQLQPRKATPFEIVQLRKTLHQ